MIIAADWDDFDYISEHKTIGAGTHAMVGSYLSDIELVMGTWHKSKERVIGDNPYVGYLTNKKWHLNEVFR